MSEPETRLPGEVNGGHVDVDELFQRLPDEPYLRGDRFEQLVCDWLTQEPMFAATFNRVHRWRDWPLAWGADAGIDLIAETIDGEYWAIQAKAYDPRYSITKRDVDTFLSE